MPKRDCLKTILKQRIVTIVRTHRAEDAKPTVWAIARSGIKAIEISLTIPGALSAIKSILSNRKRDFFMGAGTVLNQAICRQLLKLGIDFIVSPIADKKITHLCNQHKRLVMPGAFTPTEIWNAYNAGADLVKVFPVSSVGPKYIKDLKAPLPNIPLVATSGVNRHNLKDYLTAGASAVAVGAAVANPQAIARGNFSVITQTAKHFLALSIIKNN